MQAKNDILEELRSLSVLVSEIDRRMPYGVPAGYFDGLAQLVLSRVESDLMISKAMTFSVPEGYFDGFAAQVLSRIKAGSNERGGKMEGESVQEELARLSAVVSGIGRQMPYQLPDGYFEEVSPLLTIIKDKVTYRVPADYFDQAATAERIDAVTAEPVEAGGAVTARVISMHSRGKVVKGHWWKYAAVAAVAGLVLMFSWPQFHLSNAKEGSNPAPMQIADVTQGLHNVSSQDLQTYLDDQQNILAEPISSESASNAATLDMNDSDVKNLLGDVPDGELKLYMEEHGGANDIATN